MKKIEHVYIHVGTGKTGSTSIQMSLDQCRAQLEKDANIYYAKGSSHGQLGSLFATNKANYVFNRTQGRWDEENVERGDTLYRDKIVDWIGSMPEHSKAVFSYEGLFGLDLAALSAMKEFFLQYAKNVTAILYVRGPLSHAISAMSQRIKMGRRSWGIDDLPIINYKNVISRLVGAFGEKGVVIRKFDRASLSGGDVVKDIADIIGIQHESLRDWYENAAPRMNESLSSKGLIIGDLVHARLEEIGLKVLPTEFNKKYSELFSSLSGEKIKLTSEQAKSIRDRMTENLAYLSEKFGIEFEETDEAFVTGKQVGDEALHEYGQIADIIAKLISDNHAIRNAKGQFVRMPAKLEISQDESSRLDVFIKNVSPEVWYSFKGGRVYLVLDWYDESRKKLFKTDRVYLSGNTIPIKNVVGQTVDLTAPTMLDLVCLRISLGQEGGGKLEKLGFEEWWIEVSID